MKGLSQAQPKGIDSTGSLRTGDKPMFRRIALTISLLALIGASLGLQLSNTQLAQAIENKSHNVKPPKVDPVPVPNPVETPASIKAIKAKLAADGCNLNPDSGTKKKELGKCSFLLIGDSLGNNLGYGMISELKKASTLTFTLKAKASTGLSNAWFYNWHNNLNTFLKTYKPNLVMVFLGANDRQNFTVNGKVLNFGTPSWINTYKSNITQIATAATNSGAYVLWVGMPIMKPYNYAKGETLIDQQFAVAVPKVPGSIYVETRNFTSDANGNYREGGLVNGKYTQIRGTDGIHFSGAGQPVIATYIINYINRTYHVNLVPGYARYLTK